jgi:hypothetical protein
MTIENSRRHFAKKLFGWGSLAWISAGDFRLSAERVPFHDALAHIFTEKASADAIGKEYLASVGGNADAKAYLESVASALPIPLNKDISVESLRVLLNRRIREDFRLGNTVSLKGWVVSLTEARACAFSALSEPRAV